MKRFAGLIFASAMIFGLGFGSWNAFAAEKDSTEGRASAKVEFGANEVAPAEAPAAVKNFTVKKASAASGGAEELVGEYDTFYQALSSVPDGDLATRYIVYLNRNVDIPADEPSTYTKNCNVSLTSAEGGPFKLTRESQGKSLLILRNNANLVVSNIVLEGRGQTMCLEASGSSNTVFDSGAIVQNFVGVSKESPIDLNGNSVLTVHDGAIVQNNQSAAEQFGAIFVRPTAKLIVKGGEFRNNRSEKWGGAVVSFGDVEITGGTFAQNSSGGKGGAIGSYKGSLTIDGATFSDNDAAEFGGAIALTAEAESRITNARFDRNSSGSGGAIHHNRKSTGKLVLEGVKFSNNTATSSGGALNLGFEANINKCEFKGNGGDGARWGGAVVASFDEVGKALNVNQSRFDENRAAVGGGICLYGGSLNVDASEFNNNVGAPYKKDGDYDLGSGGAINLLKHATVPNASSIKSSQFVGNKARYGAGILAEEGTLDIQSTTFSGNDTEGPDADHPGRQGGGLYLFKAASATISNGTKFIKNKASWGGAIYTSSHDQGHDPVDETKYKNLTTDDTTLFVENWAANGLYEPPKNFSAFSNLKFSADSDVLHGSLNSKSLINNYDINYENPNKAITYDANGGRFSDDETVKRFLYPVNEVIEIYQAPTKEGWTFDYWEGSSYQPGDSYTVVEDHLFTARWKNETPNIEVEDKIVEQGTDFDLRNLVVSASDKEDGDLRSKVEIVDDGGFDKDKVGEYVVTFKVTDAPGASVTKTAKVTVVEKKEEAPKDPPSVGVVKPSVIHMNALPSTGEGSDMPLLAMLMGLSGMVLFSAGIWKRKQAS